MVYENDSLIIEYSIKDEEYLKDIIFSLEDNSKRIMNFFELEKLSKKTKIVIWDSVLSYKNQLEPRLAKSGRDYKEWMIADASISGINMMTVSEVRKTKDRSDYSLEEFLDCLCHEFVHICQKEAKLTNSPGWIWEMIATNLGNPRTKKIINIDVNIDELNDNFDNIPGNYNIAFTIGKYLFETYGDEYVLKLLKNFHNEELLVEQLYEEAKIWSEEKRKIK